MKMNLKFGLKIFLIIAFVGLFTAMSAYATTLPPYILDTIKKELPDAIVRFDGIVSLPNNVIYIPVLPADIKKNPVGKVVSTFPANKKLSELPDVILFDSNFALLKVIKNYNGKPSVTDSKNIPFIIKTGIFPQDMLVPPGFVVPEDMKTMLGDLNITTVKSTINATIKGLVRMSSDESKIVPVPFMQGKTLLVTTLDSKLIYIIPSDSSIPLYSLELPNLPKFVQPVNNDNYILVAIAGKTYLDVADVRQEQFAKKIDLGYQPTEIILNNDKTKAFVAVDDDQAIFIIDLKTMSLAEKIKIKGYPKNITITEDNTQIAYQDKNNGDIYTLNLDATYANKYVYNASNVSKLLLKGSNLYILSRTDNNLQVIDTQVKDIIYKQPVSQKPVDMVHINNHLYILSAANQLDVFNLSDYTMQPSLKLSENGFSKKIVKLDDSDILLITNVIDKKYTVYDPSINSILQTVNTSVYINDLKIMNKRIK